MSNSSVEISYLWGIDDKEKLVTLTGSCTNVWVNVWWENIWNIVVDFWMFQWAKSDMEANKIIDERIKNANYLYITHAHMDHIWRVPYLVKSWFTWEIIMTSLTKEQWVHMWLDYINLTKNEIERIESKNKKVREKLKEAFFIIKTINYLKSRKLDEKWNKLKAQLIKKIWNKNREEAFEEAKFLIREYNLTDEKDIELVLEIPPVLLYDEEDVFKTLKLVTIQEVWTKRKLSKFHPITVWNDPFIYKLPELVSQWFNKPVKVAKFIKPTVTSVLKSLKNKLRKHLNENKKIKEENEKLKKILTEAISTIKTYNELKELYDLTNLNIYLSAKELVDKYKVYNTDDINKALKSLHEINYTEDDIDKAITLLQWIEVDKSKPIIKEVNWILSDAWHIEGSVWLTITAVIGQTKEWVENAVNSYVNLFFSWDLWRIKDPNISWSPDTPNINWEPLSIDYWQMETTYAWRLHPEKQESINTLIKSIQESPWKILIPAFSMQRTQEILMILLEEKLKSKKVHEEIWKLNFEKTKLILKLNKTKPSRLKAILKKQIRNIESKINELTKKLFDYDIVLDSPLSRKITDIYIKKLWTKYDLLDPKVQEEIFWKEVIKFLDDPKQYKTLYTDKRMNKKEIIISSSWMCEWGAILSHLKENLINHKSTIIFIWYCPDNTRWWKIKLREDYISIDGEPYKLNCNVVDIWWFSWHPDDDEIKNYLLNKLKIKKWKKAKKPIIVLTHWGDSRIKLANDLNELFAKIKTEVDIIIPKLGDTITIDFNEISKKKTKRVPPKKL